MRVPHLQHQLGAGGHLLAGVQRVRIEATVAQRREEDERADARRLGAEFARLEGLGSVEVPLAVPA